MTRIVWGAAGSKKIESGLDRGVLYPTVGAGVPWVGLVSITENVSGGEVESFYYDGVKYLDVIQYEDYEATLEAFTAPPEFAVCDGSRQVATGLFATQQPRLPFSLSYRTLIGNDVNASAGYKIHLLYNCMAAPAERTRTTLNEEAPGSTTSWTIYGRPAAPSKYGGTVAKYKPTSHLIIDSTSGNPYLSLVEDAIYGASVGAGLASLPSQHKIDGVLSSGTWPP